MQLKVLDLFAGIGGFALGMEAAGFRTSMFVEIDTHARLVLNKHWPNVPQHGDVQTLNIKEGEYDIICGGFPCQDISVIGTHQGLEGQRSGLWSEFIRLIRQGKPKYVLIENSPNLRNRGLHTVLTDLWESGYDAEWYCLEAGQFGAPHVRERLWIVAYPTGTRMERLISDELLSQLRSRGRRGETDLQQVFADPFSYIGERSFGWPQPLLRRGDDGFSDRVDRLKRLGNAVYPAIPYFFAAAIRKAEQNDRD